MGIGTLAFYPAAGLSPYQVFLTAFFISASGITLSQVAANPYVAIVLVVSSMFSPGHFAMWTILSVGLFNSIMSPTIFTLALKGLGRHTKQASGILIMPIVV